MFLRPRILNPYHYVRVVRARLAAEEVDLPHTVPAVSPGLFHDQPAVPRQPLGEVACELADGPVQAGVAAPTQVAGPGQDLLGAHLEHDIGVGGHPDTLGGHIAQELVEEPAVLPILDRIHPHENAIEGQ